jgi:hypothetical protein
MAKRETYIEARMRLLNELAARGYTTKPKLKVPQAVLMNGEHVVYFHTQAVYLNLHSTGLDIRHMSCDMFLDHINRILGIRNRHQTV